MLEKTLRKFIVVDLAILISFLTVVLLHGVFGVIDIYDIVDNFQSYGEEIEESYEEPIQIEVIPEIDEREVEFETKIEQRIAKETGDYGIYVKNLTTNEEYFFGEDKNYPPASTFKIYTAVITLRAIDRGEINYSTTVKYTSGLTSKGPGTYFTKNDLGKYFTVEDLLYRMIVQSDNTAQSMLFALFSRAGIEEQLETELGLENSSLEEFSTTVGDMSIIMNGIYDNTLLSEESSEFLTGLMIKTVATDRIKAGLPEGIAAANKGGTLPTSKHDVAIVYGENTDYILIVLSDDVVESKAIKTIKDVSGIIYEFMDGENIE